MLQIEHGRLLKDKLSKPRSGPWPDSRGFGGGGEYGCHFAFLLFGGHQTSAAESIHTCVAPSMQDRKRKAIVYSACLPGRYGSV